MKINQVAAPTGVTVRTLHYYDKIGLLKPSQVTEAGYRLYDGAALGKLQQILFFKELDFPLSDIKEIMTDPRYDKKEALLKQKELLLQKRDRLDGLIKLVENTIKGDMDMSFQEFDMTDIETAKSRYAAEVKRRWGTTDAYKESKEKTFAYDKDKWGTVNDEGAEILNGFGRIRTLPPHGRQAQELVARWQSYITANFYQCTDEILSGLGHMYISDQRFTENIDKHGKGTATFMAAAIESYCRANG